MNDLELLEVVAREVARATLVAASAIPKSVTPTTPRPTATPLIAAKPIKPPQRVLTASDRTHLGVCVHEAAHAVAGVALGAELRDAVVFDQREGVLKGLTRFRDCPDHAKLEIAYAGPYAQAKFQARGQRPTQRQLFATFDGHGRHDQKVLTAAGGTHLGADVQPLLERCWPAVLTVARQLHRSGEVHHETVCAALGLSDGGGYYSAQLASLRSGGRVPPFATTKQPSTAWPSTTTTTASERRPRPTTALPRSPR